MKKRIPYSTAAWFFFFFMLFPTTAMAQLNIVTTTTDIAAITKVIGGDLVTVQSITRGTQDPHFIEAKPSYMLKVNRADLLIYQGLELEIGWLPLLIQGGRNPRVQPGQPGHLDLSGFIEPIEIPVGEVDRSMGDIHPLGNPHYNLGPNNAPAMARAIADRLSLLDPENTQAYQANMKHFIDRLGILMKKWKSRLGRFTHRKVVTYHTTWVYFLEHFGIQRVGTIENRPGIPPTTKHLANLANFMKQKGVRIIIQANYFETEFSELLAEKTGAAIVVLPVYVEGTPEATDYFALIETLVSKLEAAFSEQQTRSGGNTQKNG